ncbi:MAG: PAS domain S-box protein [Pirellulales bacterium]|nr:PAS domain S-box protein [Pirellulales bacterium]
MASLEKSQESHDFELSFAATRPFDFHAWLATWQREYVFFRIDGRNRINFIAPSVREILGYEPQQMLGRDYQEFFDLDHPLHAQLVDLSDRMVASDPPGLRRCVARRGDGQVAFFTLREREIVGPSGPVGRELMGQDITARVEAELSLRQSERKYRRLVEGLKSDYVIYSHDAKGMMTYVSPSARKVLGYDPVEIVGKSADQFHKDPQVGRETIHRFAREAEAGKLVHRYVGEFRHRDGGVRVLDIQERPVFAVDGRLTAMEGIAKDVTESAAAAVEIQALKEDLERRVALRTEQLSRINEELRASEARYRDVVQTQTEYIVRWTADGTRTFVNEAFCRFRGASAAELVGKKLFNVIHEDDLPAFHEAIAKITPENPSGTVEVRNLRDDGSYSWMQWNTRAFFDGGGRPVEYQSVGRNVTELRTASDLLRQKEAHLAHLSRLATMGEMVAGIAHEVGQPLHAAKTFAEAARRNLQAGGKERIARAIECTIEISEAVTRTVQIIRRLREFTKAQPVELENLALMQVVRNAIELSAYEIRRTGVIVRTHSRSTLPTVVGDRIQLEQLFVNLLMNACQAMEHIPPADRTLIVTADVAGQTIRVAVRDHGVGIAEEDVHKLFDAFYTTKKEGMGMGLVLCKSIAEAHGGDLRFEANREGPGTTFVLNLPTGAKAP